MPAQHQPGIVRAGPNHPLVRRYLAARRQRRPTDAVALQGYWAIDTALTAGQPIEALFVMTALAEGDHARALALELIRQRIPVLQVGAKLFGRMVDRDGPDGLAALTRWHSWTLADIPVASTTRVLVADRPERPGNLGAMIRSADGAGASGVIVADSVLALASQTVIKASMGTVFSLPTVPTTTQASLDWLRDHDFTIVTAEPDGDRSYREALYQPPVAIVVGNERHGLPLAWSQAAHNRATIPMLGSADSLNVTTAAALLLYEALQQTHRHP